jgi:hypothetical protein
MMNVHIEGDPDTFEELTNLTKQASAFHAGRTLCRKHNVELRAIRYLGFQSIELAYFNRCQIGINLVLEQECVLFKGVPVEMISDDKLDDRRGISETTRDAAIKNRPALSRTMSPDRNRVHRAQPRDPKIGIQHGSYTCSCHRMHRDRPMIPDMNMSTVRCICFGSLFGGSSAEDVHTGWTQSITACDTPLESGLAPPRSMPVR